MEDHNLMDDNDYLELTQDEKTMATMAHLGTFLGMMIPGLGNVLVPFLIWFLKKDESEYIDRHAKEALNFQITITTLLFAAALLMILIVGFAILPLLIILDIAFSISAAIRASRGEFYEYPLNFRWIK